MLFQNRTQPAKIRGRRLCCGHQFEERGNSFFTFHGIFLVSLGIHGIFSDHCLICTLWTLLYFLCIYMYLVYEIVLYINLCLYFEFVH